MKTTIQSICVRVFLILACCSIAAGQTTTNQITNGKAPVYSANPANVPDALQRLQSGDFAEVHVHMLAHFNHVQAIPALEKQFAVRKDKHMKGVIASALVRLHDPKAIYWHFLVDMALEAIGSDEPDYFNYDSEGNALKGPSPALVEWAQRHNVSIDQASSDAVYGPAYEGVHLLAMTGDRRGIPLLRRALLASNHMTEGVAALGLAEMQDGASIPLIITACSKAPKQAANFIAQSLVYFDDPTAHAAASKYLSATEIKGLNDDRASGHKTPFD